MSKKITVYISMVALLWSSGKLYFTYQHFKYQSQLREKYLNMFQKIKMNQESIWDGSDLVRLLMRHAQEDDLSILKIEPRFSNQFMVIMEGNYMNFIKWITTISQKERKIQWQKIVIRKISSKNQQYVLSGAYRV